jgi:hypothetical protein
MDENLDEDLTALLAAKRTVSRVDKSQYTILICEGFAEFDLLD